MTASLGDDTVPFRVGVMTDRYHLTVHQIGLSRRVTADKALENGISGAFIDRRLFLSSSLSEPDSGRELIIKAGKLIL